MKIFAGPCALLPDGVRMIRLAKDLKAAGVDVFRGAIWKGGTFPPGDEHVWGTGDLRLLATIKEVTGLALANEVKNMEEFAACWFCDYIWTPARQMQNYQLIRTLASRCVSGLKGSEADLGQMWSPGTGQQLIIKRAMGASARDVAGIVAHAEAVGYKRELLWICERGISSFGTDDVSRWRLDLTIIPQLKELLPGLKVMVDVTHGGGRREWVPGLAMAAAGAGADGLMMECLDIPEQSPSDARQTMTVEILKDIVARIKGPGGAAKEA